MSESAGPDHADDPPGEVADTGAHHRLLARQLRRVIQYVGAGGHVHSWEWLAGRVTHAPPGASFDRWVRTHAHRPACRTKTQDTRSTSWNGRPW